MDSLVSKTIVIYDIMISAYSWVLVCQVHSGGSYSERYELDEWPEMLQYLREVIGVLRVGQLLLLAIF